jgi:hypothetical protein
MGQLLTIWTIRLSLVLFAATIFGWLVDRDSRFKQAWRVTWTLGFLLAVAHVCCAFHFYHDWSHRAAYDDTAKQTQAVLGYQFGGGLYFNYLFIIVWGIDVASIWLWSGTFRTTLTTVRFVGLMYLAFIAINGAIVFETGPSRFGGIAALALLCWGLIVRWRRESTRERT